MKTLLILSFLTLFGAMGVAEAATNNTKEEEKNLTSIPTDLSKQERLIIAKGKLVSCAIFGIPEFNCSYINLANIGYLIDAVYTDPKTKEKIKMCKLRFINLDNEDKRGYVVAMGLCDEVARRIASIYDSN